MIRHFFVSYVVEGMITQQEEDKFLNPDRFESHGNCFMSFKDSFISIDLATMKIHQNVSADIPNKYKYKVTILNFQELSQAEFDTQRSNYDSNTIDSEGQTGDPKPEGADRDDLQNEEEATQSS